MSVKTMKDILIPASLITKARRLGACKDALDWLEAEPRTFTALATDRLAWADWAINTMCSASAREAYKKADAPAREAYEKATASAREAYHKATASAGEAYDKAAASAQEAYDKATASARLTALLTLVTQPEEKQ